MSRLPIATSLAMLFALALIGPAPTRADDPPSPKPPVKAEDEIKPLPPVAIPDDPPPHEGAMIDFPLTIEPPDIIDVEVLESLPGQPITGERMVGYDGTISLGFYGDLHVRGLTREQVKVKVIHRLRNYLTDEVLGLMVVRSHDNSAGPLPPPGTKVKVPEQEVGMPQSPFDKGLEPPATPPPDAPKASPRRSRQRMRSRRGAVRQTRPAVDSPFLESEEKAAPQEPRQPELAMLQKGLIRAQTPAAHYIYVEPSKSNRVFVEVTSHNTKVYFVHGDVGVPGRFPFTGKETVLDALNYAGGFVPTAEPADIHLYRPARGGKPAKDYKIDLDAIHKGVATANLQVFPDDRLIIGRNPIVKKSVQIDRANAPLNSILNTILQYSFSARSLASINSPIAGGTAGQVRVGGQNLPLNPADAPAMTPAQRDALVKEWAEFLWSISSAEGGAMLDEKAFREALMKKLAPGSK